MRSPASPSGPWCDSRSWMALFQLSSGALPSLARSRGIKRNIKDSNAPLTDLETSVFWFI